VRAPRSLKVMVILRSVDRASRFNRGKKNQLDAQLILSIFRQPLHVSGVSRPFVRRYNRMYTAIGTFLFFFLRFIARKLEYTLVQKLQNCSLNQFAGVVPRGASVKVSTSVGIILFR
jgi:hypothetical protein